MGWKKIITSLSNALLGSLTTTGNVSASGNLYASLPSNAATNGVVVVQDPTTGKLFKTGSYGGGGDVIVGSDIDFNVDGNTGVLTNLNIQDYDGNVSTDITDGTLTITFGTPTVHTVGGVSTANFITNRFDLQEEDYTISWSYNLLGNTFVSGYLQRASVGSDTYEDVYSFLNGVTSKNVNSSWKGDTATNLRKGPHRFRVKVTTTLANGESSTVYGTPLDKSLSKSNPGGPSFGVSRVISPLAAQVSSYIEEGATGTITYSYVGGANNGWDNLGFNSDSSTSAGASTSPSSIGKSVTATNTNITTGTKYQWWDDNNLNSTTLTKKNSLSGNSYRMRSFRYGVSSQTSFSEAELQDLSGWPGTIMYATLSKNQIENVSFPISPNNQYMYIVYNSSLGNLKSGDNGILNVSANDQPSGGNFSVTTVGSYKVYRSNLLGYIPFTLRVDF